ncbi:unnamed protein product [Urochloa humidicola]
MAFGNSSPPEDREDGHEDDDSSVDDAVASSVDLDSGQDDDRGAASEDSDSEDSDDGFLPYGQRAVQLLAIRANFPIRAINGYDWQQGRCIYRHCKEEHEVQGEGMVDLVPIGPRSVFMAYGCFSVEVFPSTTSTSEEGSSRLGAPIIEDWDVLEDRKLVEYTQTVSGGPGRKLEFTYLVIPSAINVTVEVRLKFKDLIGSRSRNVYGKIKASTRDYGNKSVHLFSCERGSSCSMPSGSASILPLSPSVIALPYRQQLELYIELDLTVITIFDNQEENDKNLKFTSLKFTHGIRRQEREVDGDQVVVSTTLVPDPNY